MPNIRSSKEFSKSIQDMSREEIEDILATRKYIPSPEEQEAAIGLSPSDPLARVDITLCRHYLKYILQYNQLCREGHGKVVEWDDTHVCYQLDQVYIRPFTLRHTREMTPEQSAERAERMRTLRTLQSLNREG